MKIPVNQANYPTSFFANNINVDVPREFDRDTNTNERDVINSLNSLVVEVKLKFRIWVMFCIDGHGFCFLSIGLQEVCSEPVIDLVDVLLESFEVMPAVDWCIQGSVIGIYSPLFYLHSIKSVHYVSWSPEDPNKYLNDRFSYLQT